MPKRADDPLAPVTLVTGGEELLVDRAVAEVVAVARADQPGTQTHDLVATEVEPGRLAELTSPSLFGERRVMVLRGVEAAGKAMVAAIGELLRDPPDDVILVLVHAGGNRGKALLEAVAEAGARKVDCPPVRQYRDRLDFVAAEARRAGGSMSSDGARALLDAVGTDLRELAMACAQLVADTGPGPDGTVRIDAGVVARYYTGRAEATSCTVADR
ncbi:MAG: DNA polymerase III subunit delta, partial [Streptosporangiales bacterium]|nr:DNA polymerase III subunit delta [Streptosporangiales bacterium]